MLILLEWADKFLLTVSNLGDILLLKPFEGLFAGNGFFYQTSLPNWLYNFLSGFLSNASYGDLILGAGLAGLLSFKLIKFYLDIVL